MLEAKKIYVKDACSVVIICPYCIKGKTVSVEKFKGRKTSLKVKCSCTKSFLVDLEFRKKIRKDTRLQGSFINNSKKNASGSMLVTNLSLDGLEFTTMDVHLISQENELTVEFFLDDVNRTKIERDVLVRRIDRAKVGCQFSHDSQFFLDKALGFYLMK